MWAINLLSSVVSESAKGEAVSHINCVISRWSLADGSMTAQNLVVDTSKSFAIYKQWLEKTKPGPGPDGTRRPMWLDRPIKPVPEAYRA